MTGDTSQLAINAWKEINRKASRYASCRLPDGVIYVALLEVGDGTDNPLGALPAFGEFQGNLKDWPKPLVPEQLTPAGSYRLF